MSHEADWDRVKDLVHEALMRAPDDRAAFVRAACGSDEVLHAEVVSLLAAHAEAGTFVEQPAFCAIGDWRGVAADSRMTDELVLRPGDRVGPYRVEEPIGAGGMGQVYRAHDTALRRDVAIKVLPAAFAADRERLARFEREARVLATLKHPNIATIYGIEEVKDVPALVLELIDGMTLAQRLEHGPLGLDDALMIGGQLTEALEAAHEKGIVHRDLKPANIILEGAPETNGSVKVVDFGLAKTDSADDSHIRTVGRTDDGRLLGTVGYMSPEQARGQRVDKRTDIWAFGCVLFEVLAGSAAFPGKTTSDQISAILDRDPDWSALPAHMPTSVDRLLRRCLDKDLTRRLRDIADARIEIEDARATLEESSMASWRIRPLRIVRPSFVFPALVVILVAAIVTTATVIRPRPPQADLVRFAIEPPQGTRFSFLALSPDGSRLVFTARDAHNEGQLWIRSLDALESRPLPGTEDGVMPFWSPDGRHVGFFAHGKLKTIDVVGGPPETLCEAPNPRGGSWNRDGVIVFAPDSRNALVQIRATGGSPAPATYLDSAIRAGSHRFPYFLPDGRHFLYLLWSGQVDRQGVWVGSIDSHESVRLVDANSSVAYTPPGYLLFVRDENLMAQTFDVTRLILSGHASSVANGLGRLSNSYAAFSVSERGSLAYHAVDFKTRLTWFDRSGRQLESLSIPPARIADPALSRDGRQILFTRADSETETTDIFLYDDLHGVVSRVTTDPGLDVLPVWSSDATRMIFRSNRNGPGDIYLRLLSGGNDELLVKNAARKDPTDWSPDGRFVLYDNYDSSEPTKVSDMWVLPLFGDRKPHPYQQTTFTAWGGRFSPDGQWIAYAADERSKEDVYIQAFPATGVSYRVSSEGGGQPAWRRDGRELFYIASDGTLMAVTIRSHDGMLDVGVPTPLFRPTLRSTILRNSYDVAPSGDRFLINRLVQDEATAPVTVVLNWQEELKQRVPLR